MQNTTKDGSSMVGMEQCRISSIESNTVPLLDGEPEGVSSSPPVTTGRGLLLSQKSRGSHSSGGSSGGPDDLCGATEQEPLLPSSFRSGGHDEEMSHPKKGSAVSAHVNRLHFDVFDHCQDDGEPRHQQPEPGENGCHLEHDGGVLTDSKSRIQSGSNDTVCTSSSAGSTSTTTSATLTAASQQSAPLNTKSSIINRSPPVAPSGNHGNNGNNKLARSGHNNNRNKRLRHLSTDTDDTSDISATLEPPDGGWGWVVVAASFLVNLIADGVTFSFGVFFMEFTTFFKQSESTTAWIGSMLAAMPLLSGPVASWLTDRYGCRKVTIVGGLLAALGFVLSSLTSSVYILMVTIGVITGFGLSLCYVAAVVIVAYYFERRRSFATGLSVCGGGIGTFLFAPLSQYLIHNYGWQITTRILAGAFLSLCACGLLMKDLEWTKKKNKSSGNNNSNSHHTLSQHHHHHGCSGTNSCHHHHHLCSDKSDLSLLNCPKNTNRRCNSAICIPTFVQEQERRERRQRYYSCNQDSDNVVGPAGGSGAAVVAASVKPDLIMMDRASSPGGGKYTGKTCLKPRHPLNNNIIGKDQFLDANDLLLAGLSSSPYHGIVPDSGGLVLPHNPTMEDNNCPAAMAAAVAADLEEHLIPGGGDLRIIPEEKLTTAMIRAATDNPEIVGIAQQLLASDGERGFERSVQIIEDGSVLPDASSPDLLLTNHIHHLHLPIHNNDNSNNCSVNNSTISSNNGVVRNNSFVRSHNLHNSVSSITTTMMPPSAAAPAPNGIPTIIIPPAQQTKQSVNSSTTNNKLEMINSAKYRSLLHRHSLTYRGAVLNLKRYRLRPASSCPDIISVATSTDGRGSCELIQCAGGCSRWIHSVWEIMNTRFLLFILSNLLLYTWYDVPYMYLQTAAVRNGFSEDFGSYLISAIGLSNVIGNILLGYLGDKEWASATHVYGVCMIICGGTTCLMPYMMEWDYWGLITICGIFGLTIAANYALTSVILVQVVSLERFANAYGLLLWVQGIGNLVGPPIAGVISDMTGTNTWSFLVAGVGIFLSSFFVLAPVFQRELESDPGCGDRNSPPPPHRQPTHVGHVGHNEQV